MVLVIVVFNTNKIPLKQTNVFCLGKVADPNCCQSKFRDASRRNANKQHYDEVGKLKV